MAELSSVHIMDEEEPLVKGFEFHLVKSELQIANDPLQIVKEEWPQVKEDPDILTFKSEPKDEFTIDEHILGLEDEQDNSLTLTSNQEARDQEDFDFVKLSEASFLSKEQSQFHSLRAPRMSTQNYNQDVHSNEYVQTLFYKHTQVDSCVQIYSRQEEDPVDDCEKSFSYQSNAKYLSINHSRKRNMMKPLTNNIVEKNYKCQVCGKCFKQLSHLKAHSRIHSSKKNYKCDKCGSSFSQGSTLWNHLKIHTGEKNYKCDQCNRYFIQIAHLKDHLMIHTGEKNYKCEECGKCFSVKSNLKRHFMIHTGEKNYKCDLCGKCFNQISHLEDHLITHTGEKKFKCEKCGKCFNRSSNLQTHLKIHAGEKKF